MSISSLASISTTSHWTSRFKQKSADWTKLSTKSHISADSFEDFTEVEPSLSEIDVRYGIKTSLIFDEETERYVPSSISNNELFEETLSMEKGGVGIKRRKRSGQTFLNKVAHLRFKAVLRIRHAFIPEGVTPSYYNYIKWRIAQRYISSIVHVLGTQSLLLGLGIKNKHSLGIGAAMNWVLKDTLGKIVRMLWAAKMGRNFDSDAKRWRFRSSLLFALGNGLEVMTYVFPHFFLILATFANAAKQISMLTSSSTRNAIYNCFREGKRENIGDITAKGEAQIAVCDLLGIASGLCLSRFIGVTVKSVVMMWVLLQILEIICMYQEIKAVVYRMLNFERLCVIVDKFVNVSSDGNDQLTDFSGKALAASDSVLKFQNSIPTSDEMAEVEKIFLPPNHFGRKTNAFGSIGRAKLRPEELMTLMKMFEKDKFLLVVGKDVKNMRQWWYSRIYKEVSRGVLALGGKSKLKYITQELEVEAKNNCHIVLHTDADDADIVKSTLALSFLRKKLAGTLPNRESDIDDEINNSHIDDMIVQVQQRRSRDCMELIDESRRQADDLFPTFLEVLSRQNWATPSFGRVSMRAQWPLKQ